MQILCRFDVVTNIYMSHWTSMNNPMLESDLTDSHKVPHTIFEIMLNVVRCRNCPRRPTDFVFPPAHLAKTMIAAKLLSTATRARVSEVTWISRKLKAPAVGLGIHAVGYDKF